MLAGGWAAYSSDTGAAPWHLANRNCCASHQSRGGRGALRSRPAETWPCRGPGRHPGNRRPGSLAPGGSGPGYSSLKRSGGDCPSHWQQEGRGSGDHPELHIPPPPTQHTHAALRRPPRACLQACAPLSTRPPLPPRCAAAPPPRCWLRGGPARSWENSSGGADRCPFSRGPWPLAGSLCWSHFLPLSPPQGQGGPVCGSGNQWLLCSLEGGSFVLGGGGGSPGETRSSP